MDFILEQERIAHESFDVYNHLAPHQERALYQCLNSELERCTNVISGDYNSGKRLVLSWLVKLCGGATLIAVASKLEMIKWKHHLENCPHRIDYLPLWRKKKCAMIASSLCIVWYRRFIVDVSARPPTHFRWMYNHRWRIERSGRGDVTLLSPFSFSIFRIYPRENVALKDWKYRARFENSFVRLYSLLAFVASTTTNEVVDDDECPICCESTLSLLGTSCRHSFCHGCIFSSFLHASNFKCPMCRKNLEGETFAWLGKLPLSEAVILDFETYSTSDEYAVIYDARNRFPHIPIARLGERFKVCRIVNVPKWSSIPLPHVTHLFSTTSPKNISSTLLKKFFSSFERKNILKIFYFDN